MTGPAPWRTKGIIIVQRRRWFVPRFLCHLLPVNRLTYRTEVFPGIVTYRGGAVVAMNYREDEQ